MRPETVAARTAAKTGIAVAVFRYEQVITHQQRGIMLPMECERFIRDGPHANGDQRGKKMVLIFSTKALDCVWAWPSCRHEIRNFHDVSGGRSGKIGRIKPTLPCLSRNGISQRARREITCAKAYGYSSVIVSGPGRSCRGRDRPSRSAAPPVIFNVGCRRAD